MTDVGDDGDVSIPTTMSNEDNSELLSTLDDIITNSIDEPSLHDTNDFHINDTTADDVNANHTDITASNIELATTLITPNAADAHTTATAADDIVTSGPAASTTPTADDDESSDNMPSLDFLDPEHPLLQRIQASLAKQLTLQSSDVEAEILDKTAILSELKVKRESLGVELYSLQQALASRQALLERSDREGATLITEREQAENNLNNLKKEYLKVKTTEQEWNMKKKQLQKEVEQVHQTLQQVTLYTQSLADEVKVTRAGAFGEEAQMIQAEKIKLETDKRIEQLNEQIRNDNDQIILINAQILEQNKEKQNAQKLIEEIELEMSSIKLQIREYMNRWKTTVTSIERRDTALRQADKRIDDERENLRIILLGITADKKLILVQRDEHEKLTQLNQRIQSECDWLNTQIHDIENVKKQLNIIYLEYKNRFDTADEQHKINSIEIRHLEKNLSQISNNYVIIEQEKKNIEMNNLNIQMNLKTINIGKNHIIKKIKFIKNELNIIFQQINEIENEHARITIDTLHTTAHNEELNETLKKYNSELKEKDLIIEKYENEINLRHDKIEKKQIYIANLNKKYEQILIKNHNEQGEEVGPLEGIIIKIKKEIDLMKNNREIKEKEWMRVQNELCDIINVINLENDNVRELNNRNYILIEKKNNLILENNTLLHEKKNLDLKMKNLHLELLRCNQYIAEEEEKSDKNIQENNFLEQKYINELKERENICKKIEENINDLMSEKQLILTNILDCERNLLLWEKKFLLEKETLDALDPTIGQTEVAEMKKEIKRMQQRSIALQKEQQKMIINMEKAIERHGETQRITTIANKKRFNTGQKTLRQIKEECIRLKDDIKNKNIELNEIRNERTKGEEEHNIIQEEIIKQRLYWSEMERKRLDLEKRIENANLEKKMIWEETVAWQKQAKKYDNLLKERNMTTSATDNTTKDLNEEKMAASNHNASVVSARGSSGSGHRQSSSSSPSATAGSSSSRHHSRLNSREEKSSESVPDTPGTADRRASLTASMNVAKEKSQRLQSALARLVVEQPKHADFFDRLIKYLK